MPLARTSRTPALRTVRPPRRRWLLHAVVLALALGLPLVATGGGSGVSALERIAAGGLSLVISSRPGPGVPAAARARFTVDTDLTEPSGVTAAEVDRLLAGTPLAGLGLAFTEAEARHHVSARYLVAHAIEESAWGTSQLARDKHNLFGYGADDIDPSVDAATFPSFAACIDRVSTAIQRDYLTPGGPYFHGRTLRAMSWNYSTDPAWPDKITEIANRL